MTLSTTPTAGNGSNKPLWIALGIAGLVVIVLAFALLTRPQGASKDDVKAAAAEAVQPIGDKIDQQTKDAVTKADVQAATDAANTARTVGDTNTNLLNALTPKVDAIPQVVSDTVAAQLAPIAAQNTALTTLVTSNTLAIQNLQATTGAKFTIVLEGPATVAANSMAVYTVTSSIANVPYQILWSRDKGPWAGGSEVYTFDAANDTDADIVAHIDVLVMSTALGGSQQAGMDIVVLANECTILHNMSITDQMTYTFEQLREKYAACPNLPVPAFIMSGMGLTSTVSSVTSVTMTASGPANFIAWDESAPMFPAGQTKLAALYWRIPAQVTEAQYEDAFAHTWAEAVAVGAETHHGPELQLDQHLSWFVYCRAPKANFDPTADYSVVLEESFLSSSTTARAFIQIPFDARVPVRADYGWKGCVDDFYAIRLNQ